jgi:esterase/lipase
MKFLKILAWIALILVIAYLLGPHPSAPSYSLAMPVVPQSTSGLENFIEQQESRHKLKPDNQARIIWFDSSRRKTSFSIVYLHGFSASQGEGDPVHLHTAKKFGCNLYLSRLAEHGIDTIEPLRNLTPDKYWESAKEALAIGKQIGGKVILMSTSTGGSLALKLAAEFPGDVHASILMSPNIAIFDKNARLLNNPWGLQIARMITGSNYIDATDQRSIYRQYWTYHYPLEAAVQLEELLETSMTKRTFRKVLQPTLMMYYYKDEIHQDSTVSVAAMKKMFADLGTPSNLKRSVAIPNAGNHVIGSYIRSKDIEQVEKETDKFIEEVLHLQKLK